MSKPSEPSETLGEVPPSTCISEWLLSQLELCDPVGKQFKRKHPDKHEERVVCHALIQ